MLTQKTCFERIFERVENQSHCYTKDQKMEE